MCRLIFAFMCLTGVAFAARVQGGMHEVRAAQEEEDNGRTQEVAAAELEQGAAQQGIRHDGRYFVFLEVYELRGSRSSSESKSSEASRTASAAVLGRNVAGLAQIADGANATGTSGAFYHSEVVFCDRRNFPAAEQTYIEDLLKGSWWSSYQEVPVQWWERSRAPCFTLSFAGGYSNRSCSGISRFSQYLSTRRAGIGNADTDRAYKYVYGTTDLDAGVAAELVCGGDCGLDWTSDAYHPISRNCNFFSSTMLSCILDLSQSTPNLGVSDMRTVWKCSHCKPLRPGQSVRVKSDMNEVIPAGVEGKVLGVGSEGYASVDFGNRGKHWVSSKDFIHLENVWKAGDHVLVKTEFKSLSNLHTKLRPGKTGRVVKIDSSGDALVVFDEIDQELWVDQSDFEKLVKA